MGFPALDGRTDVRASEADSGAKDEGIIRARSAQSHPSLREPVSGADRIATAGRCGRV